MDVTHMLGDGNVQIISGSFSPRDADWAAGAKPPSRHDEQARESTHLITLQVATLPPRSTEWCAQYTRRSRGMATARKRWQSAPLFSNAFCCVPLPHIGLTSELSII